MPELFPMSDGALLTVVVCFFVTVAAFGALFFRGLRKWERKYFDHLGLERTLTDLKARDQARRLAMRRRVG